MRISDTTIYLGDNGQALCGAHLGVSARTTAGNGEQYRTGKLCIERCGRAAGTWWSKLWCVECNIARLDRIDAQFSAVASPTGPQAND